MKKILIGIAIVLLAFFFRFNNLNWDDNFHLHPDERFLTMVGTAMKLPSSINQYFDQKTSLLNPANIGYKFFVYGRFPLILTKYLAVNLNLDNYNDLTILGRQLSAFFDLLIIFFIIKTGALFEKNHRFSPNIKYWAGFFYAIAVYPIQASHFFTTDTFLNFFMFGSFYFALKTYYNRPFKNTILSATFFSFALACKISAVYILPLNFLLIIFSFLKQRNFKNIFLSSFIYLLISYLILRLADPYYFQNSSLINPLLNTSFIDSIRSLTQLTKPDAWYPPIVQWVHKPKVLFSLFNLAVVGLGIPYFISMIIGLFVIIQNFTSLIYSHFKTKKKIFTQLINEIINNFQLIVIFLWAIIFFFYQSTQFIKSIRYFIFLYPFLAIFAGIGMGNILEWNNKVIKNRIILHISYLIIVAILLIWPVMFSTIYFYKHTRIEASEWIYKNLPNGSYILSESWDDSLPLSVENNYGKQFTGEQLPVFDPDTPEKWQKINKSLEKADYYIPSSNRGWGSIPTVPEKYPKMTKFYADLLKGICDHKKNFCYKEIKEFKPYYNRFINWSSKWIEETFTVYDHPEVIIFKKYKN